MHIDEVSSFARIQRLFLVKNLHITGPFSWKDQLSSGKKTMFIINHGPAFGPWAFFCSIIPYIDDLGFGHIDFTGVPHPFMLSFPRLYKYIGIKHKAGKKYTISDYIELFTDHKLDALVVAPEGEHCFYGNGLDITPFRSPGSIEIALKADCDIILTIGKGFEIWHKNIKLNTTTRRGIFRLFTASVPTSFYFDHDYIEKAKKLSVQRYPRRIRDFYVYSKIYKPRLRKEDLAEDKEERKAQLHDEAKIIRVEMQKMVDELKEKYP